MNHYGWVDYWSCPPASGTGPSRTVGRKTSRQWRSVREPRGPHLLATNSFGERREGGKGNVLPFPKLNDGSPLTRQDEKLRIVCRLQGQSTAPKRQTTGERWMRCTGLSVLINCVKLATCTRTAVTGLIQNASCSVRETQKKQRQQQPTYQRLVPRTPNCASSFPNTRCREKERETPCQSGLPASSRLIMMMALVHLRGSRRRLRRRQLRRRSCSP